jgi:hypothetical protein
MSSNAAKPARNRGDVMMTIGAGMIAIGILFGASLGEAGNYLTFGGIALGVLGWGIRNSLRRQAAKREGEARS